MSFSSEELYIYTLDLINKNSTNSKANLTKREFVELYKVNSIRYINYLLNNRNDDLIRTISNLRTFEELVEVSNDRIFNEFVFPEDYLSFINITAIFSNSNCSEMHSQVMTEIKPEEIDKYYNDAYNEPSLKHAESLYYTSGEGIIIYKKDFDIKSATLNYYRNPSQIDIVGYTKLDGSTSQNINPDLHDSALIEIAIMIAKQFAGATEDTAQFQILSQTQQSRK